MAERKALTEKELRFCAEYAADPNATQAYLRAFGPGSYRSAQGSASKLLSKPIIQEEVKAAREEYQRRCRVNGTRVVKELSAIAFVDPADAFDPDPSGGPLVAKPLHKIPAATRRAIQSVKVKRRRIAGGKDEVYEVEEVEYKFAPKDAALDKLSKHLGLYAKDEAGEGGTDDALQRLSALNAEILVRLAERRGTGALGGSAGDGSAVVPEDGGSNTGLPESG